MLDGFLGLSANRRFAVLGIAAGLLVAAVVLGRFATAPEYVTLMHDTDLAQIGGITDALTKASITYQLGAGGSDVQVASGDAARARVLLAKAGLPASSRPGMELFDKPSWGMTDFTQHVTYRRALEGELARTIGTLRGVQHVDVHLALPEQNALRKLDQPAEAAVVLGLQPGAFLSADQVRGIAQLVSSSVEQLPADRVAVIDDSGRLLSGAPGDDSRIGLSSRQLDLQQGVEKHLEAKIEPLVSAVVGQNAARVQVSARLNFDQVERNTETYDPEASVLTNEQKSQDGVDKGAGTGSQTVVNNTYANSRRLDKLVGGLGNITRLSVSVMVDEHVFRSSDIADSRRAQLEQIVKTAVGFDSTRGDQVTVLAVPFGAPAALPAVKAKDEKAPAPSFLDIAHRFALPAVALVAVIAAFILGLRALRPPRAAVAASAAKHQLAAPEVVAPPAPEPVPEQVVLRNKVAAESLSAPESAARVVRAWLVESS